MWYVEKQGRQSNRTGLDFIIKAFEVSMTYYITLKKSLLETVEVCMAILPTSFILVYIQKCIVLKYTSVRNCIFKDKDVVLKY